ncbi:putative Ig domain-containing protein, partial [Reyranella soli]|uniref:putative Ig domain-containing protein n=1 Tax=Reyranella soli TaxID=1230389 RepID=UPI001C3FDDCE
TNASHSVTVRVTDLANNAFDKTFAIATTNVNEAPLTVPLITSTSENGLSFSRNILIGASDPDQGDHLVVLNFDATATTNAGRTLAIGADYTLTGSTLALTAAGFAKFNELSAMQSDQVVFRFNVSDGGLSTPNSLALTINGANDAPSLVTQTANQSATSGKAYVFALPGNTFQDVDNGDHLALSATKSDGSVLPAWLDFDPTTGIFSGVPAAADVGGFDVKVTARDTGGLLASESFHFTVGAETTQNHSPVISSNGGGSAASVIITDHSKYVATVHAADPDGSSLTYSIVGGKNQKLFSIDPLSGLLSFKSYPQDGQTYQVSVAASDGKLSDTQTLNVSVANGPCMVGHSGAQDTFVFKSHSGLEIVKGFDASASLHDVLELDHSLFCGADPHASASEMFELVRSHSFQLGRDVIIVTDSHEIIDLQNVAMKQLTADSFHII